MDFTDPQADKHFIFLLQSLGANIEVNVHQGVVKVFGDLPLKGGAVDINPCIDCLPLLACLATYGKAPLSIYNGKIARTKECDRISSIATELKKMGAILEEFPDGLTVYPSSLKGCHLFSYHDHRMALSLSVAALGAKDTTTVYETKCIHKTYQHFIEDFQKLGANISC